MCFKSKTKPVEPAPIPAGSASSLPKREAIKAISTSNFQTNTYQAPVAPAKPFTGVAPLNNSFNSSGIAGSAMYGGGNTFNSNLSGNQPLRSPKATISYAAQDYDSSPLTNQNGFISTKRVTHFVQDRGDRPEDYAYQINQARESKLIMPNNLLNYDLDYEGGVSKTPIINTFHYESILNHCFLNRQGENINRGSNIIQRNSNINSNSGIYTNTNNVNAGVYNSGITPTYNTGVTPVYNTGVLPSNTSGVYNSGVYQPNTSNVVNLVQPTTGVIYNNDPTYVNPTGVNPAYNVNTSGINNNQPVRIY